MKPKSRHYNLIFVAFLAVLPFILANEYYVHVACMIGIWVILNIGLNLIYGYTGQISLGHGAFYGVGAYGVSYFEMHFKLPFVLSSCLAIAISGAFAFVLGMPTLRLRHHYLALATLGFGLVLEVVMIQWERVTGGAAGLYGIPDLTLFNILLEGKYFYYVVLTGVLLVYYVNYHLLDSSFGRAFVAIRESEIAGATLGIHTYLYKNIAFTISAMIAAVAGCIYAHLNQYLSPELFGVYTSIYMLSAVVVGGTGKTFGAVFGALFVILLPEFLYVAADYSVLVNASILLIVLIFLPEGVMGFVEKKIGKRLL
jgi:branched-chain amino acid transport system permease protein